MQCPSVAIWLCATYTGNCLNFNELSRVWGMGLWERSGWETHNSLQQVGLTTEKDVLHLRIINSSFAVKKGTLKLLRTLGDNDTQIPNVLYEKKHPFS